MAFTSTFEASSVLEDYLLQSARAVAAVAQRVEEMPGMTPQDAQVLSAVLFGTPKPSASEVVSLVNYKRRRISKEDLPAKLLSAISVSRFSQDSMSRRAGDAVREICGHIGRVKVPGKGINTMGCGILGDKQRKMVDRMRERHSIAIGMTSSGAAVVDIGKYTIKTTNPDTLTDTASPSNSPPEDSLTSTRTGRNTIKKKLQTIFASLDLDDKDLDSVISLVDKTKALHTALAWAGSVKAQLFDKKTAPQEDTITGACLTDAIDGVYDMYNMFRDNFLQTASPLTKEEDINKVQNGMKRCVDLINANALERVVTALLFYSCFKVVNETKELIGIEGGVKKKLCIELRNSDDIFTALCFFFQSFPANYADILYSVDNLTAHRAYAEGYVRNLLTGYSNDPGTPWEALNEALNKKREIVRNRAGLRDDVVECRVNLSSPMYVVIYDALSTIRELVEGLENFLIDVRDKQILFDNYLNGR